MQSIRNIQSAASSSSLLSRDDRFSISTHTKVLIINTDSYEGVDYFLVFTLLYTMVVDIAASKLSVIFRGLIHRELFPMGYCSKM